MKRLFVINMMVILVMTLAACGGAAPATEAPVADLGTGIDGADQYGERYDADPAVLTKSVGTPDGVPQIALAALYRAGCLLTRRGWTLQSNAGRIRPARLELADLLQSRWRMASVKTSGVR